MKRPSCPLEQLGNVGTGAFGVSSGPGGVCAALLLRRPLAMENPSRFDRRFEGKAELSHSMARSMNVNAESQQINSQTPRNGFRVEMGHVWYPTVTNTVI
jgi:hypothetical protein